MRCARPLLGDRLPVIRGCHSSTPHFRRFAVGDLRAVNV